MRQERRYHQKQYEEFRTVILDLLFPLVQYSETTYAQRKKEQAEREYRESMAAYWSTKEGKIQLFKEGLTNDDVNNLKDRHFKVTDRKIQEKKKF